MSDSVYKIIELVGTSAESWDKAGRNAVEAVAWLEPQNSN